MTYSRGYEVGADLQLETHKYLRSKTVPVHFSPCSSALYLNCHLLWNGQMQQHSIRKPTAHNTMCSLFDFRRRPGARPPTEPLFRIIQLMLNTPPLLVFLQLIPYIQTLHAHNTKQLPIVPLPRSLLERYSLVFRLASLGRNVS